MSSELRQVRAMLREFRMSGLVELSGSADDWQFYFAREGAGANPLSGCDTQIHAVAGFAEEEAPDAETVTNIAAEHLGIFVPVVGDGAAVTSGDQVGTLNVLNRQTAILADRDGKVSLVAEPNAMVEFDEPLISIAG